MSELDKHLIIDHKGMALKCEQVITNDLMIDGVQVTASAAEINTLAGGLARSELTAETNQIFPVLLTDFTAVQKDPLPDSPDATNLGLADTAASVITGTTVNGGATASASETAHVRLIVPQNYVAAGNLVLRLRSKVSALPEVGATIDAVVKEVTDGALGSDICATSAITLTASYANCDFTITGTSLVPGDILDVVITAAADDTGGTQDAYVTIAGASLLATTKG